MRPSPILISSAFHSSHEHETTEIRARCVSSIMDQRQEGSEAEIRVALRRPAKAVQIATQQLHHYGGEVQLGQGKRKRALVGLNKGATGTERRKTKTVGAPLKLGLMPMEREMVEMVFHFHKRKLKEEEEAAILLMALSCSSGTGGAVYA